MGSFLGASRAVIGPGVGGSHTPWVERGCSPRRRRVSARASRSLAHRERCSGVGRWASSTDSRCPWVRPNSALTIRSRAEHNAVVELSPHIDRYASAVRP